MIPEVGSRVRSAEPGATAAGTVTAHLGRNWVGGGVACRVRWDSGGSSRVRPVDLVVLPEEPVRPDPEPRTSREPLYAVRDERGLLLARAGARARAESSARRACRSLARTVIVCRQDRIVSVVDLLDGSPDLRRVDTQEAGQ